MSEPLNVTAPASVEFVDQVAVIHFFDGREAGEAALVYSVVVSTQYADRDRVLAEFAYANWSAVHEGVPMPKFKADLVEQFYDMDGDGIYWKSEDVPMSATAVYTLMRTLPAF